MSFAFRYVECDIPEGMTVQDWRHQNFTQGSPHSLRAARRWHHAMSLLRRMTPGRSGGQPEAHPTHINGTWRHR